MIHDEDPIRKYFGYSLKPRNSNLEPRTSILDPSAFSLPNYNIPWATKLKKAPSPMMM